MPDSRSLQLFQDQLLRGLFAQRHLQALGDNPKTVQSLINLIQCTKELVEQQQSDPSKGKRQGSRNILCLRHAVCQEGPT